MVALRVRSSARAGEQALPPEQEYDYPTMLNKALPLEIRVLGWTDVAPEFNARHVLPLGSCVPIVACKTGSEVHPCCSACS